MNRLSSYFHLHTAPLRDKSQTPGRQSKALVRAKILGLLDGAGLYEAELILRGEGCTRFQPKRRASIDHRPGPSIAREAPIVASKRGTALSPAIVRSCHVSNIATRVPAMGVQRPGIRRSPNPARNAQDTVVLIGGSLHSVEPARITSEQPRTSRSSSKPMPGRPPAKVEYRRLKTHLSNLH